MPVVVPEGHHTGPVRGKEPRRSNYPVPPDVDGREHTCRTKGRGMAGSSGGMEQGEGRALGSLPLRGKPDLIFQAIPQG